MRIWQTNASGTSKHIKNNAHKMVGMLMELLSDDLKVKVKDDRRFPSLKVGGDIKGLYNLLEEKFCGVGDGAPKVHSWVRHLKILLNLWQTNDQSLANYRETKDAQRAFASKLNEGGVTLAPDFLVNEILRQEGMNDNEIKNLKYGSKELAKKKADEKVPTEQTEQNLAWQSPDWKTSMLTPLVMIRRIVHSKALLRRLSSF